MGPCAAVGLWRGFPATTPNGASVPPLQAPAPGLLAVATLATLAASGRRSGIAPLAHRRGRRSSLTQRLGVGDPVFASILSTQKSWRAAIGEIKAEANYLIRSYPKKDWDFGVAFVSGYEGTSIVDVARALDKELGTKGALLGVAVDGAGGQLIDGSRGAAKPGEADGIVLTAVQLPEPSEGATGLQRAKPFFVSKKEMMEISQLVCQIQGQTRVRGSTDPPTVRAWRRYLGAEEGQPKGILLFVDPMSTKFTVQSVLASLDLAFPKAVKFGGVCADLLPSQIRVVAAKNGEFVASDEPGIAGLLLPSSCSVHALTTPGSVSVGPELRVTLAKGQVVKEINDLAATKALDEVTSEVEPLQRLLIQRSGFLLGFEAPETVDSTKSKEYDDLWGSSERAPSYAQLAKQAHGSDWLVRSIDPLPNGTIVVQREDLKRVPRRVGAAWLRCQLHVADHRWARREMQLMIQRYLGARMMLSRATPPIGAIVCACPSWSSGEEDEEEVGVTELQEAFGEHLPIARAVTHGEVAPTGVALGGVDQRRTARLGHTCSCCLLSYEP